MPLSRYEEESFGNEAYGRHQKIYRRLGGGTGSKGRGLKTRTGDVPPDQYKLNFTLVSMLSPVPKSDALKKRPENG